MTAAAVEPTEKAEIPFNKQPRDWRKAGVIVAFSAIPVALLVIFTYWPFGSMIGYSFYKMKYIGPRQFVGLQNYIDVFTRPDTLSSLKLSLYYMVGALIQVALALYLSTMLAFKVRGGSAFKAIYFFPYLINGIAVGFIFKFFYTRGYVFDTVLQWCGFQLDNLPYWLKDQSVNNWSLVGASVWRYLGQNVILFIGAMMSIDSTLYEAAEIDGANKWQQFKHIILPGIKTILVLNVILSITGSLSAFEGPYVITTGAMTIPLMTRIGYKPAVAAGIESAASVGGALMPPVMGAAAFVMAEITGIPYGDIIVAAALGAVLYYFAILAAVHFEAKKIGIQPMAAKDIPAWREVLADVHLVLPIALLVYLMMERWSGNYAAFCASLAALKISRLSSFNARSQLWT